MNRGVYGDFSYILREIFSKKQGNRLWRIMPSIA